MIEKGLQTVRFPSESALQEAGRDGKAVRLGREDHYDFRAGLFYSPVVYQRDSLATASEACPERWTDGLTAFVRDEFTRRVATPGDERPDIALDDCDVLEIDFVDTARSIVEAYEVRYVYGNPRLADLADSVRGERPASRLHALLCTDEFGQRLNRAHVDQDAVATALARRMDERAGLHGVMPCLPFRDQNPFRTPNTPSTVTLAEALFLARLHAWKIAIYRILPGGGHMVCACDGTLYADALGVPIEGARQYMADLRLLRDKLDLGRSISFVDLREIAEAVAASRGADFWKSVDACEADLRTSWAKADISDDVLGSLVAGMRWNVRMGLLGDTLDRAWAALEEDPQRLVAERGSVASADGRQIVDASLRYAAINLVLRHFSPLSYAFPDFMRFTMHAKPGQAAFARLGSVFPWNGTAVLDSLDANLHLARVEPLHRIIAGDPRILVDPRWSAEPLGILQSTATSRRSE